MSRNKSNNETKNRFINIHYAIGREDDCIVIDEDVSVTEEIYRAYKRPIWAVKKAKERKSRCTIGKDNGKTKRCTDDCSQCEYFRSGSDLSLEVLMIQASTTLRMLQKQLFTTHCWKNSSRFLMLWIPTADTSVKQSWQVRWTKIPPLSSDGLPLLLPIRKRNFSKNSEIV